RIRMLALNTPLNPTGTAIEPEALAEMAHDIVAENERRRERLERPVFLMYAHVYWALDFERTEPITPPGLVPEVAPYTVLLDAIQTNEDIRRLLLERAALAVVPFQAFGLDRENGWFRLSVGGVFERAIEVGIARLGSLFPGAGA